MSDPGWRQTPLIVEPATGTVPAGLTTTANFRTVDALIDQLDRKVIYHAPFGRSSRWSPRQRSEFIESVMLGFPLTALFFVDDGDGRFVTADGWQRLSTLGDFVHNRFPLTRLTNHPELNGRHCSDLAESDRRRLSLMAIPVVELRTDRPREIATDVFRRLNVTAATLTEAEYRAVALDGPFYRFALECSNEPSFRRLLDGPRRKTDHGERLELTLRFFVFSNRYQQFVHEVATFIDEYVADLNRSFFPATEMRHEFLQTMDYVSRVFPFGFQRAADDDRVPRVRFEAISVGVNLAARSGRLNPAPDMRWLESDEFAQWMRTEASNSQKRLAGRIEFVRDRLVLNS